MRSHTLTALIASALLVAASSSAQAQFGNKLRDRLGSGGKTEALIE